MKIPNSEFRIPNSNEDPLDEQTHEPTQLFRCFFALLQDLGMGQWSVNETGRGVGGEGKHEDPHPHVAGRDDLWNGRHPDNCSAGGSHHSNLRRGLERGAEPPDDPLFITLFPNLDDGSVTVVEPPVMVELKPKHRRQIYASCITALEEMIQGVSPL